MIKVLSFYHFNSLIEYILKTKEWNKSQFASKIGINSSSVTRWLDSKEPTRNAISIINDKSDLSIREYKSNSRMYYCIGFDMQNPKSTSYYNEELYVSKFLPIDPSELLDINKQVENKSQASKPITTKPQQDPNNLTEQEARFYFNQGFYNLVNDTLNKVHGKNKEAMVAYFSDLAKHLNT